MRSQYKEKIKLIYRSQPFFKRVNNIDSNFISKYIFFILMMLILSIVSSLLIGFGITIKSDINQTLKAISIFCVLWCCLFFIWWIEQTYYYIKLKKSKNKLLEIFSFIPIFNLVSIIRLSKTIKSYEFWNWLKLPYIKNENEFNFKNYKTKQWYLNLVCLILMSPMFVLLWMPEYNPEQISALNNLWFEGFQYFTIQTNLLCYIYSLCFVISPMMKQFNKDSILICLLSYLFVVSITYNFIILPSNSLGDLKQWSAFNWTKTCWDHIINPIVFIVIGIYNLSYSCKKYNQYQDYLTVLKFGMIIPTIYLLYSLILPFVTSSSVYGFVSNCNPSLKNLSGSLLEYGQWYLVFVFVLYWFIFVGIITMFWKIKYNFYIRNLQNVKIGV